MRHQGNISLSQSQPQILRFVSNSRVRLSSEADDTSANIDPCRAAGYVDLACLQITANHGRQIAMAKRHSYGAQSGVVSNINRILRCRGRRIKCNGQIANHAAGRNGNIAASQSADTASEIFRRNGNFTILTDRPRTPALRRIADLRVEIAGQTTSCIGPAAIKKPL